MKGSEEVTAPTTIDTHIMRYVWTHTKRQQWWILLVVLVSMPTYFLALDLPRAIINGPIQGVGFAGPEATQRFLKISFSLPAWLSSGGTIALFPGVELTRLEALAVLSALFLLLVIANGLFKLYINTYKGKLGERMLRRLRYDLIDRVLRFPISRFKRVKSSEIATMVKDEIEPLGAFIGDSYVQPLYQGGQAITAMIFIVAQNAWLGLIAVAIVVVQAFIIPKLRHQLIVLGRERQLTARELAGRVGEIVESAGAIHVNDTSNYERAEISARLGKIYAIRFKLYQRKFFVKFLNNFLAQITPFLFYAIGGYLALKGTLDVGQLVAVIAAYKDLPSPIKELIDWDQQRMDVQVKFSQVLEQFSEDGMLAPALQHPVTPPIPTLTAPIAISNLAIVDDAGTKLIERATLTLPMNERVAVIGPLNSGSEALAEALARLIAPTGGRITVNGSNLLTLPEGVTGRRLAYIGPEDFLPQATVLETLLYVLKHVPVRAASRDPLAQKTREAELAEAKHAGNTLLDIQADWVDYEAAGAKDIAELLQRIRDVARIAGLYEDIFSFGLRGFIDPDRQPDRAVQIIAARKELRHRLSDPELAGLVEVFDPNAYNPQATVAENLLFGTPIGPMFNDANLAANDYVQKISTETGLDSPLFEMGREIASTAIELFKDVPPDHPFFEQLSFMTADQIPEYEAVLRSIQGKQAADVTSEEHRLIVHLTFAYVEPRHRMGLLDEAMKKRIIEGRGIFRQRLPEQFKNAIEFYDPERYNKAATLQDNILLGRITHGIAGGPERVVAVIRRLLQETGLEDLVFAAGLDFNIGSGGLRLSAAQRQKIGLARALLKRPDYAIFKRPLSALDVRTQDEILAAVLECSRDAAHPFGVLWVLSNPKPAMLFDKVAVFELGVMTEFGSPQELAEKQGAFARVLG